MDKNELFQGVKKAIGVTTNYQDAQLRPLFDDVIQFLVDGGAAESSVLSESATGIIARGVTDLWNYGSGSASLSPYFMQRAVQFCCKGGR